MKAAWVTGSAKRLGKAIALRLAREGYFTFVHYLKSRDEAQATLDAIVGQGGQGALLKGDVSKPDSVRAMARTISAKTGRLDVLVHNVGVYRTGSLLSLDERDFTALLNSNTVSALSLIRATAPLFPKQGGSFVALGYSGISQVTGTPHNAAYLATKSALLVLVKSLALELAHRRIRVNMVSPGILDNSVELPKRMREFAPLGRLGRPGEIADAIAFLSGDAATYITGVNLDVAGGYMTELKTLGSKDTLPANRRRKV